MSEVHEPKVLVEVCVSSLADVATAVAAGADRVELCGALELGGLTPSIGLVESAVQFATLPVVVMLRPRAGGFRYDEQEFAVMLRDLERFVEAGAAGIAFGILDEYRSVDTARCREVVRLATGVQTVFHRAFDFIADQRAALDALIEIGITRVLTSGGKPTAVEGASAIRRLMEHAARQIEIMPGGRIRASNAEQIVHTTGCRQIHVGAITPQTDGSIAEPAPIELVDRRFMHGTAHCRVSGDAIAEIIVALRTSREQD